MPTPSPTVQQQAAARPISSGKFDIDRYLSEKAQEIRSLSVETWSAERAVEIVGTSPALLDTLEKARKIAPYREPVLITGESGTGKELIAQVIYLLSGRTDQPYVTVNCPQYREGNLTVSELFGHEKGSFTGAVADREGAFAEADGGQIFLDEIADLHLSAQAMLLRALAAGEFRPVGSDQSQTVNVRVVAATNRALDELVVAQEFRNDLFFRLRYFQLAVPPLRERGDDWKLILEFALERLRCEYGVDKHFSEASMERLSTSSWPGNVRQLLSVVTMGYAMADGDTIRPDDFASQLDTPQETRRTSEFLYSQVASNEGDFWELVHGPFLDRSLNRAQVKAVIARGLEAADGSYRELTGIFGIPDSQYQKFMDFLRHHDLKP